MTSVSYNVCLNNEAVGPIFPMKGRGSPLTLPLCHIICADGISALIKHRVSQGVTQQRALPKGSLISDDSFLFFRANIGETEVLKNILDTYEAALGQAINFRKCFHFQSENVFFSLAA